jgi:hypothetical protein
VVMVCVEAGFLSVEGLRMVVRYTAERTWCYG